MCWSVCDVSFLPDFFHNADNILNPSFNSEVSSNFLVALVIVFTLQSSYKGDSRKRSHNSWDRQWTFTWFVFELFILICCCWGAWHGGILNFDCRETSGTSWSYTEIWWSSSSEDLPSIMLSTVGITSVKLFSSTTIDGKTEVGFWGGRKNELKEDISSATFIRLSSNQSERSVSFKQTTLCLTNLFLTLNFLPQFSHLKFCPSCFFWQMSTCSLKWSWWANLLLQVHFNYSFLWTDSCLCRSDLHLKDKLHDLHFGNGFFPLQIREWRSIVSFRLVW